MSCVVDSIGKQNSIKSRMKMLCMLQQVIRKLVLTIQLVCVVMIYNQLSLVVYVLLVENILMILLIHKEVNVMLWNQLCNGVTNVMCFDYVWCTDV